MSEYQSDLICDTIQLYGSYPLSSFIQGEQTMTRYYLALLNSVTTVYELLSEVSYPSVQEATKAIDHINMSDVIVVAIKPIELVKIAINDGE